MKFLTLPCARSAHPRWPLTAEEDKLLEPANLVHRKFWKISRYHRKYLENFTHKFMSMTGYSDSARGHGLKAQNFLLEAI